MVSARDRARIIASALTVSENGLDDPDQQFYENYVCGAERNYTGYCDPEVDKLIDQQSSEPDIEKRRKIVWEIERKLAEDGARPIDLLPALGLLLVSLRQEPDDHGQQQLQRLAVRRRLARPIGPRRWEGTPYNTTPPRRAGARHLIL